MSKFKAIRERKNLTQEEVSAQSGISVRTIQRIESGKDPKGFTLRALAKSLDVAERELLDHQGEEAEEAPHAGDHINLSYLKLINLSSILFIILPPLNILLPLILMLALKQKHALAKQVISVQVLWTILAPIIFIIGIFLKMGNQFTLGLIVVIGLSNLFIILRNAIELDRNRSLSIKLNFNMI